MVASKLHIISADQDMTPKNRRPTHPGGILLEEFLKPTGMSQVELARQMGGPIQRVNALIKGRRHLTAETAMLLSCVFGNSPEFWMKLQVACDLYDERVALKHDR